MKKSLMRRASKALTPCRHHSIDESCADCDGVTTSSQRASRKGEASPNRNRLVELSKVVEIINRPGDLMWASAQDWLIEQMDALASPVSETGPSAEAVEAAKRWLKPLEDLGKDGPTLKREFLVIAREILRLSERGG